MVLLHAVALQVHVCQPMPVCARCAEMPLRKLQLQAVQVRARLIRRYRVGRAREHGSDVAARDVIRLGGCGVGGKLGELLARKVRHLEPTRSRALDSRDAVHRCDRDGTVGHRLHAVQEVAGIQRNGARSAALSPEAPDHRQVQVRRGNGQRAVAEAQQHAPKDGHGAASVCDTGGAGDVA